MIPVPKDNVTHDMLFVSVSCGGAALGFLAPICGARDERLNDEIFFTEKLRNLRYKSLYISPCFFLVYQIYKSLSETILNGNGQFQILTLFFSLSDQ